MNKRLIFLGIILLATSLPALADELRLLGHSLDPQQAQAQSDTVFLGKLVGLDPVKATNAKGEYVGQVIYISRAANGITPARTLQNSTVRTPAIPSDLGIPVTMTVGVDESAPRVGNSYLFYAKDNKHPGATGYEAVKLSPTEDHGLPSRIF